MESRNIECRHLSGLPVVQARERPNRQSRLLDQANAESIFRHCGIDAYGKFVWSHLFSLVYGQIASHHLWAGYLCDDWQTKLLEQFPQAVAFYQVVTAKVPQSLVKYQMNMPEKFGMELAEGLLLFVERSSDVILENLVGGALYNLYLYYGPLTHRENLSHAMMFLDDFVDCKLRKASSRISLVCKKEAGYELNAFDLGENSALLDTSYNDDTLSLRKKLILTFNEENAKGIAIFHGEPGVGKSHFLRSMIRHFEKDAIYVPPEMTERLADPAFLTFLTEHPNSVLIIEDAESVLSSRAGGRNAVISNLLNLTDGLLSDCLKIQIIATLNMETKDIDPAILRKGRLIAIHKFEKLCVAKSQQLSDSLGFKNKIHKPMTLSEIYGQNEPAAIEVDHGIGFRPSS